MPTTGLKRAAVAVCTLFVALGLPVASALLQTTPAAAATPQALINGDTVVGGTSSIEATDAVALGFNVTVVTGAQWDAMTAAQFAAFQLLIIGDPDCIGDRSYLASATSNSSVWGGVVLSSGGQVAINGTDPGYHNSIGVAGASKLISASEAFAGANAGATGAYVSLGCSDLFTPLNSTIPMLDSLTTAPAGTFRDEGLNGEGLCEDNIKIITFSGPTSGLTDSDLSNWGCSVHESFDGVPPDYNSLAIALDATTKNVCGTVDGVEYCGGPYVLVRGAVAHHSNLTLTPASATNPVGGSHTVTAAVVHNCNPDGTGCVPESGKTVTFVVVSGPNMGQTGTGAGPTNGSGQTTFTYTDTGGAGTDTIQATFVDDSGATETSNQVTKTWTSGAQLSIGNGKVFEGDAGTRIVKFPVTLSPASTSPVTVDYTTANGTAQAPLDYTTKAGTLTFPAGSTSQQVSITINGNTINEGTEYFKVKLSNPQGAALHDASGTGVIIGDDPGAAAAHLDVGSASVYEGVAGSSVQVMVTLSKASASPVSVHFATANGSATAPGDYTASSGNLTFSPGQTTKAVTVAIAGDTTAEGTETFTVQLSAASGAPISHATGTVKILNGI